VKAKSAERRLKLLASASATSCGVYLAELNLFVVFSSTSPCDHGAHVLDVLRLGTSVVPKLTKGTDKTEALATAGEAANEGRGTFVLTATDLYANGVLHAGRIA
jgi:hypothetical protein